MAQCIDCGVPVTSGLVIHKECYETLKKAVQWTEIDAVEQLRKKEFFERCYITLSDYLDELESTKSYLRLADELESVQAKIVEVSALMQLIAALPTLTEGESGNIF
ncbi:hypothetical protein [Anaerotruncus colihominis]|uniref:Uncharacterized protein n=1 Tax=Anaerotruncus colihominis TaxID=169435 RepID=A0A845STY4_9FIRM|nr:hypothetical protein [Anaerotruncus colihominis]NDO37772.1 hypothetical protein [Anaerotruncus colihominis]